MKNHARIKRFDKTLPLPECKTRGAAAFDLTSHETVVIHLGVVPYTPMNVIIETPSGYMTLLVARSSF